MKEILISDPKDMFDHKIHVTKTEVLWDPIRVVFSLFDETFNF